MSTQNEIWQVMIDDQVYEADTETLKEWASEGRILPTDKVKKGSLAWNDANRVPMLRAIFSGQPIPPSVAKTPSTQPIQNNNLTSPNPPNFPVNNPYNNSSSAPITPVTPVTAPIAPSSPIPVFNPAAAMPMATGICRNHPQVPAKFVCRVCSAMFCQDCPKKMGSMAICTACGDMCNKVSDITEKATSVAQTVTYYGQGKDFGVDEFVKAAKYPFQHLISLISGAIVYAFLVLGSQIGFGSLMATVMATVFLFGCMSLTIRQVAMGRMDRNFMPDFSAFSIFDDVIKPLFLSVGVSIVSVLPVIILFFALSSIGGFFAPKEPAYVPEEEFLSQEDIKGLIDGNDAERDLETAKKLQKLEPTRDIGVRSLEKEEREQKEEAVDLSEQFNNGYLRQVVGAGLIFILVIGLGLLWAFFYYPMAITIAGFTQDFWSVINPVVGIDTMRRMGMVYVKAFLMYAAMFIAGGTIKLGIFILMAPIVVIPFFGMAVYETVAAVFTFYFSLVISCILGLALYKCAEELDIAVDK
ncbi:MAG: B-box zinc finger protein [Blastocatellia bacterium]